MSVTEAQAIEAVEAFAQLSVQTSAQNDGGTNTSANLLYETSSEIQGNWTLFYADTLAQISDDETQFSITLSDVQTKRALSYLIRHLFESKSPNFSASSIQDEGYVIRAHKSLDKFESPSLALYNKLIEDIRNLSTNAGTAPDMLVDMGDSLEENYPKDWLGPVDKVEIDEI